MELPLLLKFSRDISITLDGFFVVAGFVNIEFVFLCILSMLVFELSTSFDVVSVLRCCWPLIGEEFIMPFDSSLFIESVALRFSIVNILTSLDKELSVVLDSVAIVLFIVRAVFKGSMDKFLLSAIESFC